MVTVFTRLCSRLYTPCTAQKILASDLVQYRPEALFENARAKFIDHALQGVLAKGLPQRIVNVYPVALFGKCIRIMSDKIIDSITPIQLPCNDIRHNQRHPERSRFMSFEGQTRCIASRDDKGSRHFIERLQVFLCTKHANRGTAKIAQDLIGSVTCHDERGSCPLLHGRPNGAAEISDRVSIRIVRTVHCSDKQERTTVMGRR